jgi:gamma-glutamylcyclotransferase (GGCT)/AIG2-like uncharacterized protein YtfP
MDNIIQMNVTERICTMDDQEYLFVYGTLLKSLQHAMHEMIDQYTDFLGAARLQGKLYTTGEYPCAVLSDDPQDRIYGELYLATQPFELFMLLDEYEGCGRDFPMPTQYIRKRVPVFSEEGQLFHAWVYLYNWNITALKRINSGSYIDYICRHDTL